MTVECSGVRALAWNGGGGDSRHHVILETLNAVASSSVARSLCYTLFNLRPHPAMNPDSPPTKKLRLDDTSDHDARQSERTLPVGQASPTKSFLACARPVVLPDEEQPPGKPKFDREVLSAVIREDLSPETVAQLELASNGDLERGG